MFVLDAIFDLDFYQDWWWNLALVGVVFYVGLTGYTQKQYPHISFYANTRIENSRIHSDQSFSKSVKTALDVEKSELANKIIYLMENERLFLQPELSLNELAQHLQTNSVQLSATINQMFNKNFNDFINGLRIEEFIKKYNQDVNKRYTLLSLALDSGFNSKATFNRAFKNIKGSSPNDFFKKNTTC
jgi:AraC-like DNA-binding protein